MPSKPFDVILNGKLIDTVWDQETDPNEVKRSLVRHDGYDSRIVVKPATSTKADRPYGTREPYKMQGEALTEAIVWRVYLNGKEIDAVWSTEQDADAMKKSLINHDGYDPGIVVKKERPRPSRGGKTTESLREAIRTELAKQLREEEQEDEDELKELTGAAAAGAFATPFAFQGSSASGKKKHTDNAEQAGYKVVQGTDEAVRIPLREGLVQNVDAVLSPYTITRGRDYTWKGDKLFFQSEDVAEAAIDALNRTGFPNAVLTYPYIEFKKTAAGSKTASGRVVGHIPLREGLEKEVDLVLRDAGLRRGSDYEWDQGHLLFYAHNDADDAVSALHRDFPNAVLKYPYIEFGVHPSMRMTGKKPVTEAGDPYYAYRNDETATPRQKLGRAIMEVNRRLLQIEVILRRNARLKKEVGLPSGNYWKRTGAALTQMEGRITRIAHALRQLRD